MQKPPTIEPEPLIPKHGGYRKLKSFQIGQLVYDITVRFCERYLDKRSRTQTYPVFLKPAEMPLMVAAST